MKVAIITVYNSPNFGSVWQAKALYDKLCMLGHEVYIFDTKARSTWSGILRPEAMSITKSFLTFKIHKAHFKLRRVISFLKLFSSMRIITNKKFLLSCEFVVFGSDEIWNVRRSEMRSNTIFWGDSITGIKKISYAPSINMSTYEDLIEFGAQELLGDFRAISVRDQWSLDQLTKITNKKVVKVLDPTFLHDLSYYNSYKRRKTQGGYIALYFFNADKEVQELICNISKLMGKRLVSVGAWFDWCDESVISESVFAYYLDADYIITNTFHGTAFAINLCKDFVCFTGQKRKIVELLDEFKLQNRIVDGLNESQIVDVLRATSIDWNIVKASLLTKKANSVRYLYENI